MAYAFGSADGTFDPSSNAVFQDQYGTDRSQCGALLFGETTGGPASVTITYKFHTQDAFDHFWHLERRRTDGGVDSGTYCVAPVQVGPAYSCTIPAAASAEYDAIIVGLVLGPPTTANPWSHDAVARIWREIPPPTIGTAVWQGTSTRVTWANGAGSLTRLVDSTQIFRSDDGGPYQVVRSVPRTGMEFTDTDAAALAPGSHSYFVRHVTAIEALDSQVPDIPGLPSPNSPNSAEVCVLIGAAPSAPSGLSAAVTSPSQIILSWTDNSTCESGFRLERKVTGTGTFSFVTDLAAGIQTFQDNALSPSTSYTYRVQALSTAGSSAYSNEATATTPAPTPNPPTNLSATVVSARQINLQWTDNSTNETGFAVEHAPGGTTNFQQIATLGPNENYYFHVNLDPATSHSYRVRAFNASGYSSYSGTVTATTQAAQPLSILIGGPTLVQPGATCTWFAVVSGNTPPYTYQWSGAGTGNDVTTTVTITASRATFSLDVWDAIGGHASASLLVRTDPNAPLCNQ